MKRVLEIFRDGEGGKRIDLQMPLLTGEQGNLQTLAEMKKIVVEDRLKADLRRLVLKTVVGDVPGHHHKAEIKKIFEFAQKQIIYRRDPVGVERVIDVWTTLFGRENDTDYQPEGDCGIKSVFLATCLALLGVTTFFVIITQDKDAQSFNHIYNAFQAENGEIVYLDATPEDSPIGKEPQSYKKFLVPIFD